jgi:hypothetical protein
LAGKDAISAGEKKPKIDNNVNWNEDIATTKQEWDNNLFFLKGYSEKKIMEINNSRNEKLNRSRRKRWWNLQEVKTKV